MNIKYICVVNLYMKTYKMLIEKIIIAIKEKRHKKKIFTKSLNYYYLLIVQEAHLGFLKLAETLIIYLIENYSYIGIFKNPVL